MKRFIIKLLVTLIAFWLVTETISRLLIDPVYYYVINTYNEKKGLNLQTLLHGNTSDHVDFLFVGSSRIPATINPELLSQQIGEQIGEQRGEHSVIVAGRGYMTPGIHYQALKHKLHHFPDYLNGALVLMGYDGRPVYPTPFAEEKLKVYEPPKWIGEPMPHLLLPHLSLSSLWEFLQESPNSLGVKINLAVQFFSAAYRGSFFMNEKFNNRLNEPLFLDQNSSLVNEGGIRNDNVASALELAKAMAQEEAERLKESQPLTQSAIDTSAFGVLYQLITHNGGRLVLYELPLHSIHAGLATLPKNQTNQKVFLQWLRNHQVPILNVPEFDYSDADFPDAWHLAANRRDEFTQSLARSLQLLSPEVRK